MSTLNEKVFISGWIQLEMDVNENSRAKGFWTGELNNNDATKIALMHSELSEALEALRNPTLKSDHLSNHSLLEEELADVVIRIMDFGGQYGLNLAEAIIAKHQYNLGRSKMHGGKLF